MYLNISVYNLKLMTILKYMKIYINKMTKQTKNTSQTVYKSNRERAN